MELKLLIAVCLIAYYRETDAIGTWTVPDATNTVSVDEDTVVGATSITFTNTDANTYTLMSQTPDNGEFTVASATGILSLAKALDYETQASYTLSVKAVKTSDSSEDTVTVTLNVGDKNDNAPIFTPNKEVTNVAGGACTATNVYTYAATDADGTTINNAVTTYSMTSGNTGSVFAISTAGKITVAVGKQVPHSGVYTLVIEATDTGTPAQTGTGTLSVYVCSTSAAAGIVASLLMIFVALLASMK